MRRFKQRTEVLKQLLDEEERTADPVKLQALRQAVRDNAPRLRVLKYPAPEDMTLADLVAVQDPMVGTEAAGGGTRLGMC